MRSPRPVVLALAAVLLIAIAFRPTGGVDPDRSDIGAVPAAAPTAVQAADSEASPTPPAASAPTAQPLRADPDPHWFQLQAAADGGDPRSACRLAVLLDDCRLARDVLAMVETQISVAASTVEPSPADAREIARLEASVSDVHAQCDEVPAALVTRGWRYLLRAAIAGHEASMFRFVTDPPLDARSEDERLAARALYRDNAAHFLAHLLQRGSPAALALALRAAQGETVYADWPIQRRDPVAIVRLGTALLALRDADSANEDAVARAAAELPVSVLRRARAEGRELADRLLRDSTPTSRTDEARGDDCSLGWPGMRSAYAAYTY